MDKLTVAYTMQLREIKDFAINRRKWNSFFRGIYHKKDKPLLRSFQIGLNKEYTATEKPMEIVEKERRRHEKNALAWLK